jgi:2-polyprenyl-3-methyl-5-hydroxy-6-metoxy-1,4-benzoquinol methylase
MKTECGCLYFRHSSGSLVRGKRCQLHTAKHPVQNRFVEKHYRNMGVLDEASGHVCEFVEHFGPLPKASPGERLLEVGAGVSPYIKMVTDAGYQYHGTDSSEFACKMNAERHGVPMACCSFDDYASDAPFDANITAHFLEHVQADKALKKIHDLLVPGGTLYLLIPDDEDLDNQDHVWFFSRESAIALLTECGFEVTSAQVAKIVQHESFMYFVAKKL